MGYKIKKIYQGSNQVRPSTTPIPTSGLLGYRPLQSDLKDASGNGKDGSWYSGTGTFETVGGYTGARVTENSSFLSTQFIQLNGINYHSLPITFMAWCRFNYLVLSTYAKDWEGVIGDFDNQGGEKGFFIGVKHAYRQPAYLRYFAKPGNDNGNMSGCIVTTDTWYFVALAMDSTSGICYINGNQVATIGGGTFTQSTGNWFIGRALPDGSSFQGTDGWVRQCAIYNRKLSDSEVLEYYNNTK